jgi:hypothetical protein
VTGPLGVALPVAPTLDAPHVPEGDAWYWTEAPAGPHCNGVEAPEQSFDV